LSYADLKRLARQSLEHSFLPGDSLWAENRTQFRTTAVCAGDSAGAEKPSAGCEKFLAASERAREQWKLEAAFRNFEKQFQTAPTVQPATKK
jgi:adenosine deaminase